MVDVEHRDGTPWHAAKLPRRLHLCRAQTTGWFGLSLVERCACGAIRVNRRGPWVDRNARRRAE